MNLQTLNFSDSMHWMNFLQHKDEVDLYNLLQAPLFRPVEDFFKNPGKNIRSLLVEMGFQLVQSSEVSISDDLKDKINIASSIIEAIHGGALIVDDIQDGSVIRRNGPTLHLKYGMPQALNVGNWLYFWALEQIKYLDLAPEQKDTLFESCFRLLSRAHMGQALDVGTRIDEVPQSKVYETSLASMELKTGTLMSLALIMGGALGKGGPEKLEELEELGARLGIALQMFDDLGNFFTPKDSSYKRLEDLKLRRPTWVWAQISLEESEVYGKFLNAVRGLPNEELLTEWIENEDFKVKCLKVPLSSINKIMNDCADKYKASHPQTLKVMADMGLLLENSYVKKS